MTNLVQQPALMDHC